LPPELVSNLYAGATSVLFPSHYEGFGLPIMHALAYKKPVIARSLPSAREIKERAVDGANIHLFDTTAAMVSHGISNPRWTENQNLSLPALPVWSWCDAADEWEKAIDQARQAFCFDTLRERLQILSAANTLRPQVDKLQALYDEAQSRAENLQSRADQLQSRAEQLQSFAERLQSKADGLQSLVEELQSNCGQLQTQVNAYEQSTSWRLTAPLRRAFIFMRRIGKASSRSRD
jgi:hypothetical protein